MEDDDDDLREDDFDVTELADNDDNEGAIVEDALDFLRSASLGLIRFSSTSADLDC